MVPALFAEPPARLSVTKVVKIVYISKLDIIFFSWNEYTYFLECIYFSEKDIYISCKNIILSKQKVYTFLEKSIYFFGEKYILFFRKK